MVARRRWPKAGRARARASAPRPADWEKTHHHALADRGRRVGHGSAGWARAAPKSPRRSPPACRLATLTKAVRPSPKRRYCSVTSRMHLRLDRDHPPAPARPSAGMSAAVAASGSRAPAPAPADRRSARPRRPRRPPSLAGFQPAGEHGAAPYCRNDEDEFDRHGKASGKSPSIDACGAAGKPGSAGSVGWLHGFPPPSSFPLLPAPSAAPVD